MDSKKLVKVKFKLDEKHFVWIEVAEEKLETVKENNREVSREEKRKIRHESIYSLEAMAREEYSDVYAVDYSPSPYELLIEKEEKCERERIIDILPKAIKMLTPEQRNLIQKVFNEEKSQRSIAKEEGVLETAISMRMNRIYSRLKNILEQL